MKPFSERTAPSSARRGSDAIGPAGPNDLVPSSAGDAGVASAIGNATRYVDGRRIARLGRRDLSGGRR